MSALNKLLGVFGLGFGGEDVGMDDAVDNAASGLDKINRLLEDQSDIAKTSGMNAFMTSLSAFHLGNISDQLSKMSGETGNLTSSMEGAAVAAHQAFAPLAAQMGLSGDAAKKLSSRFYSLGYGMNRDAGTIQSAWEGATKAGLDAEKILGKGANEADLAKFTETTGIAMDAYAEWQRDFTKSWGGTDEQARKFSETVIQIGKDTNTGTVALQGMMETTNMLDEAFAKQGIQKSADEIAALGISTAKLAGAFKKAGLDSSEGATQAAQQTMQTVIEQANTFRTMMNGASAGFDDATQDLFKAAGYNFTEEMVQSDPLSYVTKLTEMMTKMQDVANDPQDKNSAIAQHNLEKLSQSIAQISPDLAYMVKGGVTSAKALADVAKAGDTASQSILQYGRSGYVSGLTLADSMERAKEVFENTFRSFGRGMAYDFVKKSQESYKRIGDAMKIVKDGIDPKKSVEGLTRLQKAAAWAHDAGLGPVLEGVSAISQIGIGGYLVAQFGEFGQVLNTVGVGAAQLTEKLSPLVVMLGNLDDVWANVPKILSGTGAVLFSWPVLIVGAIAAIAGLIVYWKEVNEAVGKGLDWIGQKFESFGSYLDKIDGKAMAMALVEKVKSMIKTFTDWLQGKEGLGEKSDVMTHGAQSFKDGLLHMARAAKDVAVPFVTTVWTALVEAFDGIKWGELFDTASQYLSDNWPTILKKTFMFMTFGPVGLFFGDQIVATLQGIDWTQKLKDGVSFLADNWKSVLFGVLGTALTGGPWGAAIGVAVGRALKDVSWTEALSAVGEFIGEHWETILLGAFGLMAGGPFGLAIGVLLGEFGDNAIRYLKEIDWVAKISQALAFGDALVSTIEKMIDEFDPKAALDDLERLISDSFVSLFDGAGDAAGTGLWHELTTLDFGAILGRVFDLWFGGAKLSTRLYLAMGELFFKAMDALGAKEIELADRLRTYLTGVFDSLFGTDEIATATGEGLKTSLQDGAKAAFKSLYEMIVAFDPLGKVADLLTFEEGLVDKFGAWVDGVIPMIDQWTNDMLSKIDEFTSGTALIDMFSSLGDRLMAFVGGMFGGIGDEAGPNMEAALGSVDWSGIATKVMGLLKRAFEMNVKFYEIVFKLVVALGTAIVKLVPKLTELLSNLIGQAIVGLALFVGKFAASMALMWYETMTASIVELGVLAATLGQGFLDNVWNPMLEWLGISAEPLTRFLKTTITDPIMAIGASMKTAGANILTSILDGFKAAFPTVYTWLLAGVEKLTKMVGSLFGKENAVTIDTSGTNVDTMAAARKAFESSLELEKKTKADAAAAAAKAAADAAKAGTAAPTADAIAVRGVTLGGPAKGTKMLNDVQDGMDKQWPVFTESVVAKMNDAGTKAADSFAEAAIKQSEVKIAGLADTIAASTTANLNVVTTQDTVQNVTTQEKREMSLIGKSDIDTLVKAITDAGNSQSDTLKQIATNTKAIADYLAAGETRGNGRSKSVVGGGPSK